MKLFYSPGACSMASHIVMAELNMAYEIEAVNLKEKTCASGDFKNINSKGSVPALRMDNNEVLTEGAVIMQYLCDQKNDSTLLPKLGTLDRYRCMEWMNFIATDVHKSFSPLFYLGALVQNEQGQTQLKTATIQNLKNKISYISAKLENNDFLMGKNFTIADAYLFTVLGWGKHVGLDISEWSNINAYMGRIAQRPAVVKAMKEEGLL